MNDKNIFIVNKINFLGKNCNSVEELILKLRNESFDGVTITEQDILIAILNVLFPAINQNE